MVVAARFAESTGTRTATRWFAGHDRIRPALSAGRRHSRAAVGLSLPSDYVGLSAE